MFVASLLLVIADQVIKAIVNKNMTVGQSIPFIGDLVEWTYVQNTGSAYGLFRDHTSWLTFFTFILLMAIIVYVVICYDKVIKLERIGLTLVLAGGFGNWLDRIRLHYVIDFININIIPVFNFADICICVGCAIFIIAMFSPKKSFEKEDYKGFAIPEYEDDNVHIPGVGGDDIYKP